VIQQPPARFRESHGTILTTLAPDLSIDAVAQASITLETDRVIFVRLALFAPAFVTLRCCTRHRAESGITFPTRQNNVVRRRF